MMPSAKQIATWRSAQKLQRPYFLWLGSNEGNLLDNDSPELQTLTSFLNFLRQLRIDRTHAVILHTKYADLSRRLSKLTGCFIESITLEDNELLLAQAGATGVLWGRRNLKVNPADRLGSWEESTYLTTRCFPFEANAADRKTLSNLRTWILSVTRHDTIGALELRAGLNRLQDPELRILAQCLEDLLKEVCSLPAPNGHLWQAIRGQQAYTESQSSTFRLRKLRGLASQPRRLLAAVKRRLPRIP
jgi:hypothetical protein